LRKLRSQNRQDKVVVVSGRDAGIPQSLLARFLAVYGNAAWFQLPDGMEVSARALELMARYCLKVSRRAGSFHVEPRPVEFPPKSGASTTWLTLR
jgi:hypothetical protein